MNNIDKKTSDRLQIEHLAAKIVKFVMFKPLIYSSKIFLWVVEKGKRENGKIKPPPWSKVIFVPIAVLLTKWMAFFQKLSMLFGSKTAPDMNIAQSRLKEAKERNEKTGKEKPKGFGIAATCLAILLGILGQGNDAISLKVSLLAASIGMPLAILTALTEEVTNFLSLSDEVKAECFSNVHFNPYKFYFLSWFFVFLAVSGLVCYLSPVTAVVFCGASIVAVIAYLKILISVTIHLGTKNEDVTRSQEPDKDG